MGQLLAVYRQLVAALFVLNVSKGQVEHAVAAVNGFKLGDDMNAPAAQHPNLPLLPAVVLKYKDQCPPHTVRVKPLSANTEKRGNIVFC